LSGEVSGLSGGASVELLPNGVKGAKSADSGSSSGSSARALGMESNSSAMASDVPGAPRSYSTATSSETSDSLPPRTLAASAAEKPKYDYGILDGDDFYEFGIRHKNKAFFDTVFTNTIRKKTASVVPMWLPVLGNHDHRGDQLLTKSLFQRRKNEVDFPYFWYGMTFLRKVDGTLERRRIEGMIEGRIGEEGVNSNANGVGVNGAVANEVPEKNRKADGNAGKSKTAVTATPSAKSSDKPSDKPPDNSPPTATIRTMREKVTRVDGNGFASGGFPAKGISFVEVSSSSSNWSRSGH